MKSIRVLFQGDSITDAGRDRRNFRDMGRGYPKYASEIIARSHPDVNFDFINLGIGGNRTDQLFDRLYKDAIELCPDVISILIGINDVWHRVGAERIMTSDEQLELNYRSILTQLRRHTNAKIMMIAPYLLDFESETRVKMREELKTVLPIIRRLAEEYADVYMPLDELFAEALKTQPSPLYYSGDGVHPNENGARFIAEHYAAYIDPIIAEIKEK